MGNSEKPRPTTRTGLLLFPNAAACRSSLAYLRKNLAQISIARGKERGKVRRPSAWGW
jgi:hypothetical protein